MLNALAYIHGANRLHRDIKSDNILISVAGDIKLGSYQCIIEHGYMITNLLLL